VQALIDPGDEILVPDPRYSSYDDAIRRAGGKMVMVPTNREDAFNLEAEAVEAAITPKSKALLIVTPSNPTAGIVTEDHLRAIADVAIRHNLIVIVDEIYGKIVYEPWQHFSIGSLPGMAERTVTLDAFSKTYAMTGWRCGYVAAPANVIDAMARIKAVTTGPVATVSQWAGLAAMTGPQDCVSQYKEIYTERRAVLLEGLDRVGFAYGEPRGGLFVWADSSSTGIHAAELSLLLLQEGRVLVFPGTAFGEKWREYVRITMLEPIDVLREAVERMLPVIERYRL
jgi:aminotransferase